MSLQRRVGQLEQQAGKRVRKYRVVRLFEGDHPPADLGPDVIVVRRIVTSVRPPEYDETDLAMNAGRKKK